MSRVLLLAMVLFGACGRDAFLEDELTLRQQPPLAGTYAFGPMVGKGLPPADDSIPAPTSRLATLELGPDGTFELEYGMGCVIGWHSGTWVATPTGARLSFGLNPGWTDANGNTLQVTTVDATPDASGLVITGQSDRGAISQKWEAAR